MSLLSSGPVKDGEERQHRLLGDNDEVRACEKEVGRNALAQDRRSSSPDGSLTEQKRIPTDDTPALGLDEPPSSVGEIQHRSGNAISLPQHQLYPSLSDTCRASIHEQYADGLPENICDGCRLVRWAAFTGIKSDTVRIFNNFRNPLCDVCQVFFEEEGEETENLEFVSESPVLNSYRARDILSPYRSARASSPQRTILSPQDVHNEFKLSQVFAGPTGAMVGIKHANDSQDDFSPRVISPSMIDFSLVRTWLSHCQEMHGENCHPIRTANLPGFRVIDCRTKCIISAPVDCKYAALSYVWGKTASHSHDLDDSAPTTIKDSMTVTQSIGIQYLWIDRYVSTSAHIVTKLNLQVYRSE
jgi:hypothetical protein